MSPGLEEFIAPLPSNNVTHNEMNLNCETQSTLECVAAGGSGDQVSSQLCGVDVSASNLQDFPIIRYKFMKLSELLHFMGYVDQALVLDKASEFHACQNPRWSECAISCGAGGTLNDEGVVDTCWPRPTVNVASTGKASFRLTLHTPELGFQRFTIGKGAAGPAPLRVRFQREA